MHEGSFPSVRIPLPVVIVIALLAVAGFWWLRTKEMDFLTPKGTTKPLPEFMTNPPDEDPTPNPALSAQVTNTHTPPPSPDNPQLEFGDLESSPGLAEYSEHASKGADYLIRLATELEVRGQWERSLLAWERVIDSCHPSLPERKAAGDAIVRIRPTLTHWNIDPAGALQILMQLGTSRKATTNLKEAAQQVAEFLRRDSDHTLLIEPRITTSRSRNAPADAPIAIYFSGKGQHEPSLRSLTPNGDEIDTYETLLLVEAYLLVRQGIGNEGGILLPQVPNDSKDPKSDFQRQLTRLHWKVFAESLNRSAPEQRN